MPIQNNFIFREPLWGSPPNPTACQDVGQAWSGWFWSWLLGGFHDDRRSGEDSNRLLGGGEHVNLLDLLHLHEGGHGVRADVKLVVQDAGTGLHAAIVVGLFIVNIFQSLKETLRDNKLLQS